MKRQKHQASRNCLRRDRTENPGVGSALKGDTLRRRQYIRLNCPSHSSESRNQDSPNVSIPPLRNSSFHCGKACKLNKACVPSHNECSKSTSIRAGSAGPGQGSTFIVELPGLDQKPSVPHCRKIPTRVSESFKTRKNRHLRSLRAGKG